MDLAAWTRAGLDETMTRERGVIATPLNDETKAIVGWMLKRMKKKPVVKQQVGRGE